MSEYGYNGDCDECGGLDGNHFDDCSYDGVNSGRNYGGRAPDSVRWFLFITGVICLGVAPPLGVLLITIFLFV